MHYSYLSHIFFVTKNVAVEMSSLIAEKNKLKIHLFVCVCFFSFFVAMVGLCVSVFMTWCSGAVAVGKPLCSQHREQPLAPLALAKISPIALDLLFGGNNKGQACSRNTACR